MKKFSELGIKVSNDSYVGDTIKMKKILDKEITVHNFRFEKSKFDDNGSGQRLKMQLEVEGEKRIIFTSARKLMEAMEQAKPKDLPFQTTIVEEDEIYKFS